MGAMARSARQAAEGNRPRSRSRSVRKGILLLWLAPAGMALIASGCGGSGGGTGSAAAQLKSISLTPHASSIPLGPSQQFMATGAYSDGSSRDVTATVKWTSSNGAVATVSPTGVATTVGMGTATITASMNSITGTASLTVGPAVSVSVSPATASVAVGQTEQFAASVANTTNTAVTWSVDGVAGGNSTVGTVSSSGLYQAVAAGAHQITATSQEDPTKSAQASVTAAYLGVLTYRNDLGRTGQNLSETTLTLTNVNSTQFGKLTSYAVDGAIYAQPLYMPFLTIPNQGVHNVVYVATEHDSVYAFDADGKTSGALWQVSFINPAAGVTSVPQTDVGTAGYPAGEIGITGTPVIDPVGSTIYVVAYTKEGSTFVYRLHALDLATGAEKFGGPVVIQASVPGAGDESDGHGAVAFEASRHMQRPGLLLLNGLVYLPFGTINEIRPWHGWLLGYNATTLQQVAAWNPTPNAYGGSFWGAGGAPAADVSGNIFITTANGPFDANDEGSDYGDSVLKLRPGLRGLALLDWFSPFNTEDLDTKDLDLGSGGTVLLPDQPGPHPHLLVLTGKEGRIYLIDRDNLGRFNAAGDQIVQEMLGAISKNYSTPAYWQGNLYYASHRDNLKQFALQNGLLSTSPAAISPETLGYAGASPSVSGNGSGNGIVWVIDTSAASATSTSGPSVLRAYDATKISREIYNSSQAGARDTLGGAVKFTVPTVYAGKVYVGTATELDVLGPISQ